jgi:hypothetical protein
MARRGVSAWLVIVIPGVEQADRGDQAVPWRAQPVTGLARNAWHLLAGDETASFQPP